MADICKKIDMLLAERGISGIKMSADIGISRSFMTELRKGRVKSMTVDTAQKIADYFGVTVDYLLGNTESPLIFRPSHAAPIAFDEKKIMESAGIDPLDEIDIGFYGAYSELSEDDKKTIRQMVEVMRERRKKENPSQG